MTEHADGPHVPGQLDLDGRLRRGHWTPAERADLERELQELHEARDRLDLALLEYQTEAVDEVAKKATAAADAGTALDNAVHHARGVDVTWQRIADAAGVTKQSAWRRWHTPDEVEEP